MTSLLQVPVKGKAFNFSDLEFDNLFDTLFGSGGATGFLQANRHNMDRAKTNEGDVIITLDIPGVPKESINVEIAPSGRGLIVQYERNRLNNVTFAPIINVPLEYEVDSKDLSVNLKDGVLTIQYPAESKSRKSKASKIPVN
jgi:HSP20 family molecular chaperone IbpA